jgi:hypothetical protein
MKKAVEKSVSVTGSRESSLEADEGAEPLSTVPLQDNALSVKPRVQGGAARAGQLYQTPENFREWCNLLSVIPSTWRPGKTLSPRQPDVELLVVLLNDVPLTSERFSEMSSGRDWVTVNFSVLAVGPPGFSNVPFTYPGGKKGGKVETKVLYEVTENGDTRFYPFDKGATNKDRGVRVSEMKVADADILVDATTVIEPGTCFSFFLRQEGMELFKNDTTKKEAGDAGAGQEESEGPVKVQDILAAKSLMALVLSSNNSVQTAIGRGLKLRKGKLVSPSCLLGVFAGVPQSEELVDGVQARSRLQPSIANLVAKDAIKVFACIPDALAHATLDSESDTLVMCNVAPNLPEVFFSWEQLGKVFSVHPDKALKLVNVAIAMKAVKMLVMLDERPTSDPLRHTHSVAALAIDWNNLLLMHIANGLVEWPCAHETWGIPCSDEAILKCGVTEKGTVLWTNPGLALATPGKCAVYWAIQLTADKALEKERKSAHFLTDETALQGGHSLDLYLAPYNAPFETVMAEVDTGVEGAQPAGVLRHQMRLRFKPERKGAGGQKKRTAIQWD